MNALFAAVQLGRAFWAGAGKVGAGRQRCGTAITAGRGHGLDKPREPRSGDVNGRTRSRGFRFRSGAIAAGQAEVIGISVLPVFTIGVHADQNSWFFLNTPGTDGESGR